MLLAPEEARRALFSDEALIVCVLLHADRSMLSSGLDTMVATGSRLKEKR